MLHIGERKKDLFGGFPAEWSHRKIVILTLSNSELLFEVCKAIEFTTCVELLVVFPVAALHLSVMSGRVRLNELVPNTELIQSLFKQGSLWVFAISQTIGEFKSIVCLNTLNHIRKLLYNILEELRRRIGAMLLVCLQDPIATVFINKCVLEITFTFRFTDQAGFWNIFHINLDSLPRILHLFVRFGFLFRIRQFDGVTVYPAQSSIQPGDRSSVTTLAQLDPEHHQTGVRVSAAHIFDELDLSFSVLIGMAVRPMRAIRKGTNCSVVLLPPTVDILPGCLIADCSLCDAIFERILNYHLLKPHVLCYLIHSE